MCLSDSEKSAKYGFPGAWNSGAKPSGDPGPAEGAADPVEGVVPGVQSCWKFTGEVCVW